MSSILTFSEISKYALFKKRHTKVESILLWAVGTFTNYYNISFKKRSYLGPNICAHSFGNYTSFIVKIIEWGQIKLLYNFSNVNNNNNEHKKKRSKEKNGAYLVYIQFMFMV